MELFCQRMVFDQAVYSKAQNVRFLNPILRTRLVPRLGEFHTVMTFLRAVGKRFEDADMRDIIVESQCIAAGSIKGVLNGHTYNRSIRANKHLMESLYDLLLDEFIDSLDTPSGMQSLCLDIARKVTVKNRDQEFDVCVPGIQAGVHKEFLSFIELRSQSSPTFAFWLSYINMITSPLNFIRATRESSWELCVNSLRRLLPWFFAYGHQNYARYGTLYFLEMCELQNSHPDIAEMFAQRGAFTYQTGNHRSFAAIACDQAIEQTVNRHSKSQGGVISFTLKPSAAQRWTATHLERAAIHGAIKNLTSLDTPLYDHHGLTENSWKADEDIRMQMKETIKTCINTFSYTGNNLVSLVSGAEASPPVRRDLENAFRDGESKLSEFVQSRLTTQQVGFHAPIKSTKSQNIRLNENKG